MAPPFKLPLRHIVPVDEIHSRDLSLVRHREKRAYLEGILADHRANIAKAPLSRRETPSDSLGPHLPPLLVARPPVDLPQSYRDSLGPNDYVLVDGYQRYMALRETQGRDYKVSAHVAPEDTMNDLCQLALKANWSNALPITKGERKAHILRLLLTGYSPGTSIRDLAARYGLSHGVAQRLKGLTDKIIEQAKLDGLSFEETRASLKTFCIEAFEGYYTPRYDSKGFPNDRTLAAALKAREDGATSLIAHLEDGDRARQAEIQKVRRAIERLQANYPDSIVEEGIRAAIGEPQNEDNEDPAYRVFFPDDDLQG